MINFDNPRIIKHLDQCLL